MDSESNTESSVVEDLEKKQPCRPTTSQMVMETIKSLNMSNGAPLEAIGAFIGEYYDVNVNSISARIHRSLEIAVEKGSLEQVADGGSMRFKLKKPTGKEIKTKPQVKETTKKYLKKNHSASDGKFSPPLDKMAVESIESLKMRNGASESKTVSSDAKALEKNQLCRPTTSQMVMETIKPLNMSNGAPQEAMEENPLSELNHCKEKQSAFDFCPPPLDKMAVESIESLKMRNGASESKTVSSDAKALEKKQPCRPTTSQMVMETIKSLNMSNGAPQEAMEENPLNEFNHCKKNQPAFAYGPPALDKMVIETLKSLKMRKGAPVATIHRYINEHYGVGGITQVLKKFLKDSVEKGWTLGDKNQYIITNKSKPGSAMRVKLRKLQE